MDDNQKLEYLNRNSIKKYSGWKNYSPNVWTALHWNPKIQRNSDPTGLINNDDDMDNDIDGALARANRPSTAPPTRFGLKFNSKNEVPQKVNYLMDTVQDLQFQIQQFKKNLSQQNELIESLTDVVEKLSVRDRDRNNAENDVELNGDDEIVNDQDVDKENKMNDDKKSKKSSPRKVPKVIVSSRKNKKNKKSEQKLKKEAVKINKDNIIPTYFAVDQKDLTNEKFKPEPPKVKKDKKKINKAARNRLNRNKAKNTNKPITPRVVKSNKIKKKTIN